MEPPPVLQLAGHPIRWRILAELGRSDRRVHELTALVDQPQNLVSYHLARLREAEVVAGRRSSADGRDTYYRLELRRLRALFAEAATALHPGLAVPPAPPPPDAIPAADVLFLCTGNSARSQIAEAMVTARSGGRVRARSAGSHPKPLHPGAVRVVRERYGIDLSDRTPTHVDDLADQSFDRVVTLCDRVREVCPRLPGGPVPAHWSTPDPAAADADDVFDRVADDLEPRIDFLLAELAAGGPNTPSEGP